MKEKPPLCLSCGQQMTENNISYWQCEYCGAYETKDWRSGMSKNKTVKGAV